MFWHGCLRVQKTTNVFRLSLGLESLTFTSVRYELALHTQRSQVVDANQPLKLAEANSTSNKRKDDLISNVWFGAHLVWKEWFLYQGPEQKEDGGNGLCIEDVCIRVLRPACMAVVHATAHKSMLKMLLTKLGSIIIRFHQPDLMPCFCTALPSNFYAVSNTVVSVFLLLDVASNAKKNPRSFWNKFKCIIFSSLIKKILLFLSSASA